MVCIVHTGKYDTHKDALDVTLRHGSYRCYRGSQRVWISASMDLIIDHESIKEKKSSIKEKFIFTSQSNYIFYIIYIFTKYHEFLKCVQI